MTQTAVSPTATSLLGGLLLAFAAGSAGAALPIAVDGQPLPSLAPMVKQAAPAIVNIATVGTQELPNSGPFDDPFFRRFFGTPEDGAPQPRTRTRPTQSLGSGVIVNAREGLILTNHHVIEGADEINITLLDETQLSAELVGSDPGSDIAVLRVKGNGLSEVTPADSDAIEVGDFVVAIGNPFGFKHTVTSGIVSGLGRTGLNAESYEDFIQTDASINPGNSGGALLNLRGELVGINSAIISGTGGNIGIGFAIPVNMAQSIMEQILEFGEVRRGLLGVNIYDVTPRVAEAYGIEVDEGALVVQVVEGSAAQKAGIETGDVVVSVNSEKVKSASDLRNKIGLMRIDDRVKIGIVRDGDKKTYTATLGSRATPTEPVRVADLHPGLQGAEIADAEGGVLVINIEQNSPAAQRGLEAGDLITHVNKKPIEGNDAFREATEGSNTLILRIQRGSTRLLLPIF